MNKYSQNQDEFILQYLDGQLPMKDKVEFENTLKTDGQLQERFYQLKWCMNHYGHPS
jgi:anti-sigma factor RsiW